MQNTTWSTQHSVCLGGNGQAKHDGDFFECLSLTVLWFQMDIHAVRYYLLWVAQCIWTLSYQCKAKGELFKCAYEKLAYKQEKEYVFQDAGRLEEITLIIKEEWLAFKFRLGIFLPHTWLSYGPIQGQPHGTCQYGGPDATAGPSSAPYLLFSLCRGKGKLRCLLQANTCLLHIAAPVETDRNNGVGLKHLSQKTCA